MFICLFAYICSLFSFILKLRISVEAATDSDKRPAATSRKCPPSPRPTSQSRLSRVPCPRRMCIYIYMYVCMYVYIYIVIQMNANNEQLYANKQINKITPLYIYIYTCVYIYIYTYIRILHNDVQTDRYITVSLHTFFCVCIRRPLVSAQPHGQSKSPSHSKYPPSDLVH